MSSARQIKANQLNAKKSTGPRTGHGKQRASGNAYRHGLRARMTPNAAEIQRIEELTAVLAEGSESTLKRGWARTAAEAMCDVSRVQQEKLEWLECASRNASNTPATELIEASDQDAATMAIILAKLLTLHGYEQRCCSRRDRAFQQMLQFGEDS